MSVDKNALAAKVREMYPEVDKYGIDLSVEFDKDQDSWLIKFHKGGNDLYTHISEKEAADCLDGVECVHLGVELGRFVEAYCMRDNDSCKT
jgi:hypothetical protein